MTVRWLLAIGLVVVSGAMPSTAWAYWSSDGGATGSAKVATLPLPVVTAVSPQYSDEVEVSWTQPAVPSGMAISGYRVVRIAGGTPTPACGTTSSTPLPPGSASCVDAGLADGDADYVVTAVVGTWTTTGTTPDPVTVAADRTAPTIALSGADRSNALLDRRGGEALLFFRPADGGSIRIDAELTDTESGPESATFPAVSAAGWSHALETVSSGSGSAPTVTYRSRALDFAPGASTPPPMDVIGVDARGNERTRVLTFVADADPPTDGAVTVNGVAAEAGAPQSWDADGAFTVSGIMPYVEAESSSAAGLANVSLTRESAVLAGGSCGAFGGSTSLGMAGPIDEAGLSDGCYRYTLSGTDRVGNSASIATIVRVDTSAPTGGAVRANGVDAVPGGSDSITASGSWSVARTDYADAESGLVSSTLTRQQGVLGGGACTSFGAPSTLTGSPGEVSVATGCYRYVLTGINAAGLSAQVSTTVRVDRIAPTGGAVTVNGAAASGAGTTSTRTTSDVDVSGLTSYADAESGIASSTLVRTFAPMTAGVCGAFAPASAVTVAGTGVISGLADGCHRFTLTGIDLAGNASAVFTTVRLDASSPVSGVMSVNGVVGSPTGVMAYARSTIQTIAWTKFSDPESGMASAVVRRTTSGGLSNGVCTGTYGSTLDISLTLTPTSGSGSQTVTNGRCHRYVVTGTNALGRVSSTEVTVMVDTSIPTSTGSLRVNNSTTTNAAAPSTNGTGSYTVATVRTFADAQSGIASNVLTRTRAPVAANVCGTYDPATTMNLASPAVVPPILTETGMAPGCYRYTQTGTNAVGGVAAVSTYVRVDTTRPVGGALSVNGVAATTAGSTSTATAAGFAVTRTEWTDPESTITSTLTRAAATLGNGVCGAFGTAATVTGSPAQTGLATGCYRYVLTGNNTLVPPAVTLTTTVLLDTTPPVSGAFTVNGVAATAAGSSSSVVAGASFSVSAFTAYAETQSTLASSTFTRTRGVSTAGVCGSFDAGTTVTLPSSTQAQTGLPDGCYRYVLTGTNSFGGTASVTSTVRIDTTGPVGGALSVNGVAATSAGSTSTATAEGFAVTRTEWTDPESTVTSALTRASATLGNGVCGAFGTTGIVTGSPAQTGLTTNCYQYVLTGTNTVAPPAVSVRTIVMLDTTPPVNGVFTVNGAAATLGGSNSSVLAGANFSVSAFTGYSETQSTLASSTFTRTTGVSTAGVCGDFEAATTVTLPSSTQPQNGLANGCYQYVLTGTNSFGGAASVTSTVRVGP
jgi:hypothetical protein